MEETDGRITPSDKGHSTVFPSSLLKMNVHPFIRKLYYMVDDPTTDRVISWGSMNNSFIVKDREELERDIEKLKGDNNEIRQKFDLLDKNMQTSDTLLESIGQRLNRMKQSHEEMMLLLSKDMDPGSAPTIDSFSPGSDLIWGSSSIEETLKSMDPRDSTPAAAGECASPMDI